MNRGLTDEQGSKINLFNDFGHEYDFNSTYLNIIGSEPIYTNFNKGFNGTLDYIFFQPTKMQPIAALQMVPFNIIKKTLLPNENWSSDHVSLVADYLWN